MTMNWSLAGKATDGLFTVTFLKKGTFLVGTHWSFKVFQDKLS